MDRTLLRNLLLFGLLTVFAIGCASSSETTQEEPATSSDSGEERTATVSQNEADSTEQRLEELYWARKDSAKSRYTQDDVHFMIGMIGHHAQALIMSRLAPENGASSSVQTLASRIINAQKDEIRTMQTWLRDRGEPVPEIEIDSLQLNITGVEGHMKMMNHKNMPGMLSPQQLEELAQAEGSEFDRLFLKFMIEHHSGAVSMVEKLFDKDGAAQGSSTFKIASDIQVDQRTEIARMRLMLDRLVDNMGSE